MSGALEWATDGRAWPNRAASRFVEVGELRWHVQQMGSGPLLLLLHGTGASTHSWCDLMPLLARHFTCLAIDLPGHAFTRALNSPCVPQRHMSLGGMASAVAGLMAQERLAPVHVAGHSAGAALAAQLCLAEGLEARSIVSLNGAFFPLPGLQGMLFPSMARVMATNSLAPRLFAWKSSSPAAVRRLIAQTGSRLDARGEALYASLVRNPGHVAAALCMMANWDARSLAGRLRDLRQSLLLVVGDDDRIVSPAQSRRVRSMVSHAVIARIERCGHLAHEEEPERVAARLSDWCLAGEHARQPEVRH
ncbi:Magnesium-chelatase 30 kDa subunit [Burkholderiales bacterium 8X]|nr:Magnesium-chelatase 30 kDa subunit [Burkholderiales bacterium 8X]